MEANLALTGDSITYELTLTNAGTVGAIIEDIKADATGSTGIIYSINGLKIGDKLAGGAFYTRNSNYYLVNNDDWRTMSASDFDGDYASLLYVYDNGGVYYDFVNGEYGVRPAINLASIVEISGGNGTIDDPYVVQTN